MVPSLEDAARVAEGWLLFMVFSEVRMEPRVAARSLGCGCE